MSKKNGENVGTLGVILRFLFPKSCTGFYIFQLDLYIFYWRQALFKLQVKMMMLKVIARTVGLHRLILLNFYPFLQKYVQVCY